MAIRSRHRFRVNTDLKILCHVKTNGEDISLAGRDIEVIIRTPLNHTLKLVPDISGTSIILDFPGTLQKETGWYTITIWENRHTIGETAHDICKAFELVPCTCSIEDDYDGLDESTLELDAQIEIINKSGIYSKTVKYLNVMTSDEYGAIEHRKDTLYVLTLSKEEVKNDTQRST